MKEVGPNTIRAAPAHALDEIAGDAILRIAFGHCAVELTTSTYVRADVCMPAGQEADRIAGSAVKDVQQKMCERAVGGENPFLSKLIQET